jgi:aminopeptidase N
MQYSWYARSGELDYPDLVQGLAHEAAHIWWKDASVTTWEDWLNESFAEYSALMVLRQLYGEQYYADEVASCAAESAGAPPIWGIERADPSAYTALYLKGPVILGRLEAAIGRDKFIEFLGALQAERVNTTAGLLGVLERLTSTEARSQLESDLRR